jgi:transposase-like protein
MKSARSRYFGYRFPPGIISHAVWAYHRFCLSFRDVEDLLADRHQEHLHQAGIDGLRIVSRLP